MKDSSPVTQAILKTELSRELSKMMSMFMRELQQMHKNLYEADNQILDVLINMDRRLTGKVDDHEHRITALEHAA